MNEHRESTTVGDQGRDLRATETDRLRHAFAGLPAPLRPDCPPAETLSAAAAGELPHAEFDAVLDHVAGCRGCAHEMRLARELAAGLAGQEIPTLPTLWRGQFRVYVPLAAGLALLLGGYALYRGVAPPADPVYLGQPAPVSADLRPADDRPLDRTAPVLRWTPLDQPGVTYDVQVETLGFARLASATDLVEPVFTLPPSALAGLPPASTIRWQVTVRLPDGTPKTWTFTTTVE